jgi:hypothetical protein
MIPSDLCTLPKHPSPSYLSSGASLAITETHYDWPGSKVDGHRPPFPTSLAHEWGWPSPSPPSPPWTWPKNEVGHCWNLFGNLTKEQPRQMLKRLHKPGWEQAWPLLRPLRWFDKILTSANAKMPPRTQLGTSLAITKTSSVAQQRSDFGKHQDVQVSLAGSKFGHL